MPQIKAAVCREFGAPLTIETVTLAAPNMGEVEVTLKACAICHSDISFIDGGWGGALPAVYGHEAAGHISAVGDGVRGVAIGDPVVVTLIRACGTCPSCAGGKPVACESDMVSGPLTSTTGEALVQAMNTGGFGKRISRTRWIKIPILVVPQSRQIVFWINQWMTFSNLVRAYEFLTKPHIPRLGPFTL